MNLQVLSREKFKSLLALSKKKERIEAGKVVVEGVNLIEQLIDNGYQPLELYLENSHPIQNKIPQVPAYRCLRGDLQRLCDSSTPQSVAALYYAPKPRDTGIIKAVYLDGISDPGNMGTIFRIASAFALDSILLSEDCVEVSSPKVIRASLGSVWWVPYKIVPTHKLAGLSIPLIGLDMHGKMHLKDYRQTAESTIYIIGSEAHGISPNLRKMLTDSVKIEMEGNMESLNAAIATAILAHHLFTI